MFRRQSQPVLEEHLSCHRQDWAAAFSAYVEGRAELETQVEAWIETMVAANPHKPRPQQGQARAAVGKRHLSGLLRADFDALDGLVEEFVAGCPVLEAAAPRAPRRPRAPRPTHSRVAFAARPRLPSGRRRAALWSAREDAVLVARRRLGRGWAAICPELTGRTGTDCANRWRALRQRHGSDEAVFAAHPE